MVGFYLLALGIAALLVYLPYAEWHYAERVDIRIAFTCLVAAVAILSAVIPRIDRFVAPGPVLTPEDNPQLFGLIGRIALATRQAPPESVYLIPDLNASVAQRGGLMGFGSERVMCVGLPLLQTLTVPEFSAVLAHEFGHFHGGDTLLGPWIYKTRGAIDRTLSALSHRHRWIGKPFEWYGALFLRITHAVSRQQEYAADALAAEVVGVAPLASGLKAIHGYAPAFPAFWTTEVVPALQAGVRPPIAEGFTQFLVSSTIAPQVDAALQEELHSDAADPYDTHPPLPQRLAALRGVEPTVSASADPRAISLLGNADASEAALLKHLLPPSVNDGLRPTAWTELGALVWLPRWRRHVTENQARLLGLLAGDLPSLATVPGSLAVRFQLVASPDLATSKHISESRTLLGAAFAVALYDRGFAFSAMPGELVTFTLGLQEFHPFEVLDELERGSLTSAAYAAVCKTAQLTGQDFGHLVTESQPSQNGPGA